MQEHSVLVNAFSLLPPYPPSTSGAPLAPQNKVGRLMAHTGPTRNNRRKFLASSNLLHLPSFPSPKKQSCQLSARRSVCHVLSSGTCKKSGFFWDILIFPPCIFPSKIDLSFNFSSFSPDRLISSPQFSGRSYLALPTLTNAYSDLQLSVEFRPDRADRDAVLMLTGEAHDMTGDYLALTLRGGRVELR